MLYGAVRTAAFGLRLGCSSAAGSSEAPAALASGLVAG